MAKKSTLGEGRSTTQNSRIIKASAERLYAAFTDPKALALWLAPGNMTGKIHRFDLKVGGGYEMSLFYPATEEQGRGKTSGREDRFTAKFLELLPSQKIVESIYFDSDNPAFSGEMLMEVTFEEEDTSTKVTIIFANIPPGIRAEDNEEGTRQSLEKLARFVE